MPAINSNFKGHDYSIDEADKVVVNGIEIDIEKTEDGRYLSSKMPYQSFSSIQELVEHMIDLSPDYKTF